MGIPVEESAALRGRRTFPRSGSTGPSRADIAPT